MVGAEYRKSTSVSFRFRIMSGLALVLLLFCQSASAKKLFRPKANEPNDPNCWYNGCWKAGDNLLVGGWAWSDCNRDSGYVGTIAHGSGLDGASAEAVQYVTFYVEEDRYITFRAKILRQGGTIIDGSGAFGGTYKVWIWDGDSHRIEVDPPWGWDTAFSIAMDIGMQICDVYAPCKSVKAIMETALEVYDTVGLFLDLYSLGQSERMTIEKHFYANRGWHTLGIGLRSTASGVLWDKADAFSWGTVEEILVWGIGQPKPPTIEGPTEGCPGGYYDFTVYNDDCLGQSLDELSYLFDWDDDDVDGPTNPTSCGRPVTRSHCWDEPGTYNIQVFVQDRDDATWSKATTHTITIGQATPKGRPDPVYATEGKYCDHIDITWKPVEGAEGYIVYRDFLYHPLEHPPAESDHEIYRGPALSCSDYDIHTPPDQADTRYWVRAYNDCGYLTSDSDPNQNGQQSVVGYARRPCGAPTNVNVTDWVCGPLTITWDPVKDAPGFHDFGTASEYIIYRNTEDDSTTADEIGRTFCTNCTEFQDEPPTGGETEWYYYWVRAISDCNPGGSYFSPSDRGRRKPVNAEPPGNVNATDGTECDWVEITWNKLSGINPYNVYRDGELIYGPRDSDHYTDSDAVPGVIHTYTVEVCGDPNCSDSCPSASDTGYIPAIPPVPMGVQATDGVPCDDVIVSWQPVPGAVQYEVYRDGNHKETVLAPATSWRDNRAYENEVYEYYVTSSNGCRESEPSESDTGFTAEDMSTWVFAWPHASDSDYCDKVHITWTYIIPPGTWYSLWRSRGSNPAERIANHLTVSEYDDYTAVPGVSYKYYIRGESICSVSSLSDYDYGKVAVTPYKPHTVNASYAVDCNWISLSWSNVPERNYYQVFRSTIDDPNEAVMVVGNLSQNTYKDSTVERDTDYYYWVRTKLGPCFSPLSSRPALGRLAPDSDTDGFCNAEDNCPYAFNPNQENCCDPCDLDTDNDGVSDLFDNCPEQDNPFQRDSDGDGFGDRCECHVANFDGVYPIDGNDLAVLADEWLLTDSNLIGDIHVDGHIDGLDFAEWALYWKSDCSPVCEFIDADGDHYPESVTECSVMKVADCNDTDPNSNPGAAEICDGGDNDCDGDTDEAGALGCTVYYYDGDQDGYYGIEADSQCLCGPTGLYSALEPNDCNDSNPAAYPGAQEVCDGVDNDCNGLVDEPGATGCIVYYLDEDADGYGVDESVCLCNPFDQFTALQSGDCNETDPAINPGADEDCHDGIDNDCDGLVDFDDNDCSNVPDCWMSPTQCHGDTNGDAILDTEDLSALMNAWQTAYPDQAYDPCADFDRDGIVWVNDLNILVYRWPSQPMPPYPEVPDDCLPGGDWPPQP